MPSNAPTVFHLPVPVTHKTEHSYEGAVRATLLKLGASDPDADTSATGQFWRHCMAAGVSAENCAAVIYATSRHRHGGAATLKEAGESSGADFMDPNALNNARGYARLLADSPKVGSDKDIFLKALRALASEYPSGTLLAVGDLRSRLTLNKKRFDETALSLSREGAIILHHHDYPESLTADDRKRLIRDTNGAYYVGIALKPDDTRIKDLRDRIRYTLMRKDGSTPTWDEAQNLIGEVGASEAPTSGEWEVIIRRQGSMEDIFKAAGRRPDAVEGNLVVFGDFYDDEVAQAFARKMTKAGYIVTYGPHKMPEEVAAEGDPSAMGASEVAPVVSEASEVAPVVSEGRIPWVKVERNPKVHEAAMALAEKHGPISSAQKVYEVVGHDFEREDQEVFLVLPLNLRGELKSPPIEIARGQRSHVAVGVNDVLRAVLDSGCEGYFVCHSHPTGKCTPSKADRALTAQIKAATVPFGREVKYLDHFVVGRKQIYSIEEGKAYKIK